MKHLWINIGDGNLDLLKIVDCNKIIDCPVNPLMRTNLYIQTFKTNQNVQNNWLKTKKSIQFIDIFMLFYIVSFSVILHI